MPYGGNAQVEDDNIDDSRCSYTTRRVSVSNEIRGSSHIRHEYRKDPGPLLNRCDESTWSW